jgi:N-acetyl-beta-hexosaminidase
MMTILPQPKHFKPLAGASLNLSNGVSINAPGVKDRRAAAYLKAEFAKAGISGAGGAPVSLTITEAGLEDNSEAYTLKVEASGAEIAARTPEGLFRGAVTFAQMARSKAVDACEVRDFPDLSLRGMTVDFRYAWLTEKQIYDIIDRAAGLKINCIVWWLQDKFAWKKHPDLVHARALPAATWKKIVRYADDRFIQMVPYVDIYGHGENYLDRPGYLKLSAGEMGYWASDDVQYCVSQPGSLRLVKDLLGECLPVFNNTPYVHLGLDEVGTFDERLCPRCRQRVAALGKKLGEAPPYAKARNRIIAERLLAVLPLVKAKGRKAMFWDDSATGIKTLALGDGGWELVPPEVLPLLWFYGSDTKPAEEALGRPYARNFNFVISPSSAGVENTVNYLRLSSRFPNVIGVLTTIWEQDVMRIERRWEGFGLAASLGWNRSSDAENLKSALKERFHRG